MTYYLLIYAIIVTLYVDRAYSRRRCDGRSDNCIPNYAKLQKFQRKFHSTFQSLDELLDEVLQDTNNKQCEKCNKGDNAFTYKSKHFFTFKNFEKFAILKIARKLENRHLNLGGFFFSRVF